MNIDLFLENECFQTTYPEGWKFVWRLLSLKEYRKFKSLELSQVMHEYIFYTHVFERCYVGNPNTINGDLPAGIPISIGKMIMWLSGDSEMTSLAEDIEQMRTAYPHDAVKEHMKRTIFTAWSTYTPEDAESWSYPHLINKFVQAERVLIARGLIEAPLDTRKIHGPEGPKKQKGVASLEHLQGENRDLHSAMGDAEHPLDKSPDELAGMAQRNKGRLSRSIAKKLDQRKR